MICLVSILIGYLLGTILPAYYIGKLKGVDIRQEGAEYAGTINVYHVIGPKSAVLTCVVDLTKGIIAIQIALGMGADFHCAQLSGLAAVMGHVFPFYLDFSGGQGVACATGILLFYIFHYLASDVLNINTLIFLAVIVFLTAQIAKKGEIVSLVVLPTLSYAIINHSPNDPLNIYLVLIVLYILIVDIRNIIDRKELVIRDEEFRKHWWRSALRPVAVLFILFYVHQSKKETLILIGSVALFFLLIDIIRLIRKPINNVFMKDISAFFKRTEESQFSSITLFLISAFIAVLLFEQKIAIASLCFLIFGDLFGKIFGLAYGRRVLFHKTLEGSLAYFTGSLFCVYVLATSLSISFSVIFVGAVAATIVEALPLKIDDNLTVAIVSGTVMVLSQHIGLGI